MGMSGAAGEAKNELAPFRRNRRTARSPDCRAAASSGAACSAAASSSAACSATASSSAACSCAACSATVRPCATLWLAAPQAAGRFASTTVASRATTSAALWPRLRASSEENDRQNRARPSHSSPHPLPKDSSPPPSARSNFYRRTTRSHHCHISRGFLEVHRLR